MLEVGGASDKLDGSMSQAGWGACKATGNAHLLCEGGLFLGRATRSEKGWDHGLRHELCVNSQL